MKVVLICDVDDATWGTADVLKDLDGLDSHDKAEALCNFFQEDIIELLDGAIWWFEGVHAWPPPIPATLDGPWPVT